MIGQKCNSCNRIIFPHKASCPYCNSTDLDKFKLSGKGEIYAVTSIASGGAPPEFAEESRVRGSYFVVIVKLDEGMKIIARYSGKKNPEIGMKVKYLLRKIYDEEGVIRYGYKFVPELEYAAKKITETVE